MSSPFTSCLLRRRDKDVDAHTMPGRNDVLADERCMELRNIALAAPKFKLEGISKGEEITLEYSMSRHVAILASIILISFSSVTLAQDGGRSQNRGACRADAQKLCAGINRSAGRGAVLDCLASQKDKLSDDCRKSVESRGK
jgi:hypothetical protein